MGFFNFSNVWAFCGDDYTKMNGKNVNVQTQSLSAALSLYVSVQLACASGNSSAGYLE